MNAETKKKADETVDFIVSILNIIDINENESIGKTVKDLLHLAESTAKSKK